MIYIGQFIQSYFSTARNHLARVEKYRLSSDVGIKAGKTGHITHFQMDEQHFYCLFYIVELFNGSFYYCAQRMK